jgi:hypothetical protein
MRQRDGLAALVLAVAGIGCCSSMVLAHGGGGGHDPSPDDALEAPQDAWLVRFGHLDTSIWNIFFAKAADAREARRDRTAEEAMHAELLLDMGGRRAGAEFVVVVSGPKVRVKSLPGRQTVGKGRRWKNDVGMVGFKFPTRLIGRNDEFDWRLKIQSADGETLDKIPQQGWAHHPQTSRGR